MGLRALMHGYSPKMGCDPELFISYESGKIRKRQRVVGSEMILGPDPLPVNGTADGFRTWATGNVARDGVQVELHPNPKYCREELSYAISGCLRKLKARVDLKAKELDLPLKLDFRPVIRLSKADMALLSADSRRLGCVPSENVYGRKSISRNGEKVFTRSAAGHIHLGYNDTYPDLKKNLDPKQLVRILDVVVGNTCVMIDRDEQAALRRKLYGRAGEYRLPKYGLEYRTPSNFWLHNTKLLSMIMALTRVAFAVATTNLRLDELSRAAPYSTRTSYLTDAEKILLEKVNFKDIEQAINTNDYELARANYEKSLKPLMEQAANFNNIGLDATKLDNFEFFLQKIREAELAGNPNPLTAWFKEDPYTDWENYAMGHGWESFLVGAVQKARLGGLSIGGALNAPLEQPLAITYTPAVSIASHQQGGAVNANDSTM